mmetsp:Transcript_11054/g.19508  ORF Transcript_11054/g.19508 Transcript_11054/m.19508 type:complete len:205 (-) Transcript_11054:106-720(-)
MPSGLVQHQDIRVHQLSRAELHLHLPTARIARDGKLQVRGTIRSTWVAETGILHELLDLLLLGLGFALVDFVDSVHHPPPTRLVNAEDGEAIVLHANLLLLDLVLHEDTLQLIALREAFQLLVHDGTHQGRLAALVRPEQAVEPVPLQVHLGVAEQSQSAVGQREGALVQIDALCVLLLDLLLRLGSDLHLGTEILNDAREGLH